jgi:hypothetical protein
MLARRSIAKRTIQCPVRQYNPGSPQISVATVFRPTERLTATPSCTASLSHRRRARRRHARRSPFRDRACRTPSPWHRRRVCRRSSGARDRRSKMSIARADAQAPCSPGIPSRGQARRSRITTDLTMKSRTTAFVVAKGHRGTPRSALAPERVRRHHTRYSRPSPPTPVDGQSIAAFITCSHVPKLEKISTYINCLRDSTIVPRRSAELPIASVACPIATCTNGQPRA